MQIPFLLLMLRQIVEMFLFPLSIEQFLRFLITTSYQCSIDWQFAIKHLCTNKQFPRFLNIISILLIYKQFMQKKQELKHFLIPHDSDIWVDNRKKVTNISWTSYLDYLVLWSFVGSVCSVTVFFHVHINLCLEIKYIVPNVRYLH